MKKFLLIFVSLAGSSALSRAEGLSVGFGYSGVGTAHFAYRIIDNLELGATISGGRTGIGQPNVSATELNVGVGGTFVQSFSDQLDLRWVGFYPTRNEYRSKLSPDVDGGNWSYEVPLVNVGLKMQSFELIIGPQLYINSGFDSGTLTLVTGQIRYNF